MLTNRTLCPALILAGLATAILPAALILINRPPSTQFEVPGTHPVQITRLGGHTLWHDYKTAFGGRTYSSDSNSLPNGLVYQLKNNQFGKPVDLRPNRDTYSSTGLTSRRSIGTFPIKEPGLYELSVTGSAPAPFIISFGKDWGLKFFTAIVLSFPIGALMTILGGVIGVRAILKRNSL